MIYKASLTALVVGVVLTLVMYTKSLPDSEFDYVCDQIEVIYKQSCGDLAEPTAVYSNIINDASGRNSWYGVYYFGEPYVFINPKNTPAQQLMTLRHELTHYVLSSLQLIDNDDVCEHERIVRLISFGPWDSKIQGWYNCD